MYIFNTYLFEGERILRHLRNPMKLHIFSSGRPKFSLNKINWNIKTKLFFILGLTISIFVNNLKTMHGIGLIFFRLLKCIFYTHCCKILGVFHVYFFIHAQI